ncbi:hypothetical protein [Amycolatopsis sp. NPDC051071]|uniref:hypothetical protein n=1 Tax=Amycolatopsis sp. NPDC051071 TaxID=3154637 RepID=UPI003426E56E
MKFIPGAVVIALALAGCSTAEPPPEKVATLATTGASSAPPAASTSSPDLERPRYRLDMTNADMDQLRAPWKQCMAENGSPLPSSTGPGISDPGQSAKPGDPAWAACLPKYPLPPWQYDRNNPESMDFVHKMVQCLRQKGVKQVSEMPPAAGSERNMLALGGESNDAESVAKGMEMIPVCEKELTAGGAK